MLAAGFCWQHCSFNPDHTQTTLNGLLARANFARKKKGRACSKEHMATSQSDGKCEVVEDKGISEQDMKDVLAGFLSKKSVREGLSEDDYAKLSRFQKALEEELQQDSQLSRHGSHKKKKKKSSK